MASQPKAPPIPPYGTGLDSLAVRNYMDPTTNRANDGLSESNFTSEGYMYRTPEGGYANSSISGASGQIVTTTNSETGNSIVSIMNNAKMPGVEYLTVPAGDSQQEGTPPFGSIRANTQNATFEFFNGEAWGTVSIVYPQDPTPSSFTFNIGYYHTHILRYDFMPDTTGAHLNVQFLKEDGSYSTTGEHQWRDDIGSSASHDSIPICGTPSLSLPINDTGVSGVTYICGNKIKAVKTESSNTFVDGAGLISRHEVVGRLITESAPTKVRVSLSTGTFKMIKASLVGIKS